MDSVQTGVVKCGGYRYDDGTRYIGDWNQRGQKHGMGSMMFSDGTRYDGAFSNGVCSGLGVMVRKCFTHARKQGRLHVHTQLTPFFPFQCFPDGAKYVGRSASGMHPVMPCLAQNPRRPEFGAFLVELNSNLYP